MDKKQVEELLPEAADVLAAKFKNGKIPSTFRGYISSFGAAISMGSLMAAIAFYGNSDNKAKENRSILPDLILSVLKKRDSSITNNTLSEYVINCKDKVLAKQEIIHATIALKLAMNLFEIEVKVEE